MSQNTRPWQDLCERADREELAVVIRELQQRLRELIANEAAPSPDPGAPRHMAVAQCVRELGGVATVSDFARYVAITDAAARLRLSRAYRAGALRRVRQGCYSAPELYAQDVPPVDPWGSPRKDGR